MVEETQAVMSAEEIVALSKKHTMFEWVAQNAADPIPVDTAKGSYFYSTDGKRYLDWNSQLMSVNIGHGDQRVIDAIAAQAQKLAYANPFMAHEPSRPPGPEAGRADAGRPRRDVLHQRRRRSQRERHQAGSPVHRPAEDPGPLSLLPRRHGPGHHRDRRPASLGPARPACRASSGRPIRTATDARTPSRSSSALADLEEVIMFEGGQNIAGFMLEPVVGTNGILIPPDGYLQGVREICDKHGIMMIADEVMSGFGRTGEWFAVDHWGVVPDILTMAKGLTSSYLPLGAVAMRQEIADAFADKVVLRRPDLQQPPHGLRHGAGRHRRLRAGRAHRARQADGRGHARPHGAARTSKHPSLGAHRNIGLFGILELVRDRETLRADGAVRRHAATR